MQKCRICLFCKSKLDVWQLEPPLIVEQFDPETICMMLDVEMGYAPEKFILRNNFPNPFNPLTTIEYEILFETNVELIIYDSQVLYFLNSET